MQLADKRTLIRRATYDLIGLPPTPEEVEAFVADESPSAFERVVDRLLASPHYGEKWGRHWLDLVRYADTAGCNSDFPIPSIHRYRNYVIDSFNRDKPYDQFITEQLAADCLIVPGAGHLWFGRLFKGAVFFVALPVMYGIGLALHGRIFPFELGQPLVALAALADFGIGVPSFVARALGSKGPPLSAIPYCD